MTRPADETLEALLKGVSRSFYLSIHVLPTAVRPQIAAGYLLARAADTIADTDAVPPGRRRELLHGLRQVVFDEGDDLRFQDEVIGQVLTPSGGAPAPGAAAERRLLLQIPRCLALLRSFSTEDQARVRQVLAQLIQGMDRDLLRFPALPPPVAPERVVALQTLGELDEYTYFAAGCVGEFWTVITAAHLPALAHLMQPALRERGVGLGKGLQLVNVLRDVAADLRLGRCYWPRDLLGRHGLSPGTLAALAKDGAPPPAPEVREPVLAVTRQLHQMACQLFADAWPYVQAIPPSAPRLRLACAWPLLLGLDTLAAIQRIGSPLLVPQRTVKVKRRQVYALLAGSIPAAVLDWVRDRRADGLLDRVHAGRSAGASLSA